MLSENSTITTCRAKSVVRALTFSLAIALASLTWLTPDHAAANCVVTSGTGTAEAPDSGDTVICTADPVNPATDGIDDATGSDGVTVILESGAGISTTGNNNEGIFLDNNTVVELQSGAFIRTTGLNAEGIDIDNNGTVTLRSGSSVTTTGNGAEGMFLRSVNLNVEAGATVSADLAHAIVFRSGTVTIGGTVVSGDDNAIRRNSGGGSTINILAGASVSSTGAVTVFLNNGVDMVTIAGSVIRNGAGAAIQLGGGNDRLELQAGFNITGIVNAQGGGNDTLVFGGDQDASFDVSNLGGVAQYRNFENFIKEDASTWTLMGTGSLSNLAVNGGTLIYNVTGSSNITVNDGATLAGSGTTNSLFFNSGATVAPGMSAAAQGILSGDNVTFEAGSMFAVDIIAPGVADRVDSAGGINLNGGTVNVGGNLASVTTGQQFVIVNSGGIGGVGMFEGVTDNSAFLTFDLSYTANQALLNVTERLSFASAALTPNQQQVAAALDGLDGSATANEIENAILGLTADEARAAFEAIAGGAHAEAAGGALETAEDFTQFLLAFSGSGSAGTATATLGVPAAGYGADLADGSAPVGPMVWFGGFGGYAELDGDGNGGGHEASTFGLAGGVETDVDFADAVLGVAMGYSMSDLDVSDRAQEAHTRNFHAGLYARMGADRLEEGFAARGALTYAHHWLETSRTIAFGAIASTAEADYNGYTLSADGEVRYNMAVDIGVMDNTFLSPFVRVQLGHTDLGSFTETGAGALNLSGDADGYNRATAALGLSFSGERDLGSAVWRPSWSVAYEYAAGDEAEANLTLAGSPTPFVTRAADESRHRIRFGTLSEFAVSDSASFIFATDSVYSQDRSEISAKAGVKFTF